MDINKKILKNCDEAKALLEYSALCRERARELVSESKYVRLYNEFDKSDALLRAANKWMDKANRYVDHANILNNLSDRLAQCRDMPTM